MFGHLKVKANSGWDMRKQVKNLVDWLQFEVCLLPCKWFSKIPFHSMA